MIRRRLSAEEVEQKRLEKEADAILRNDAKREGYITASNWRGYGAYGDRYGILTSKRQSVIARTEKTGFEEEQLESIFHNGVDKLTRQKYKK